MSRRYTLAVLWFLLPLSAVMAQSPPLSPPVPLPGDLSLSPAAGDQLHPHISAGNGIFLVVWEDWRADRTGLLNEDESAGDVYAARIGNDGTLLDPIPIPIAQGASFQGRPQAAWNGNNWLVVWESMEPTTFFHAAAIHAVRLSPQGQVLDVAPIEVFKHQSSQSRSAAMRRPLSRARSTPRVSRTPERFSTRED